MAFDDSAVKKISDCIDVINQLLFFGMLNGLRAEPIQTLISLKTVLPGASQLLKELNDYVKRENASADAASNIGTEYAIPNQFRSITGM